MQNNNNNNLENTAISALAAASKTPFLTAFKVTLGIGLAHFAMFVGVIGVIALAYRIIH